MATNKFERACIIKVELDLSNKRNSHKLYKGKIISIYQNGGKVVLFKKNLPFSCLFSLVTIIFIK